MDINSIQGMKAYTTNVRLTDTASVQTNNKEATSVEPNKEITQSVQEAFKVEITPEALALQAENTENPDKENQDQQIARQIQQTQQNQSFQGRQGGQLDIIA
ncbi:hypothetical protein [Desulfobacter latus]|uniref:Uncharacterized protein n=1 Tax=Desulfobacter latus TaxID=2292 RepID=A0A850T800_9BACT|nr:hypothetical protein [Desulfobacter latus]NWH04347.1 hypothetical protein [Desulfobacter latus]